MTREVKWKVSWMYAELTGLWVLDVCPADHCKVGFRETGYDKPEVQAKLQRRLERLVELGEQAALARAALQAEKEE